LRKSLYIKHLRGGAGPGPASRWLSVTYSIQVTSVRTISNLFMAMPVITVRHNVTTVNLSIV